MNTTSQTTPQASSATAACAITRSPRALAFGTPPSHRAILIIGAQQSAPVIVRPAPMPTGRDA